MNIISIGRDGSQLSLLTNIGISRIPRNKTIPMNIENIGSWLKVSPAYIIANSDGIPIRLIKVLDDFFSDIV